jgi:hypothetical protein
MILKCKLKKELRYHIHPDYSEIAEDFAFCFMKKDKLEVEISFLELKYVKKKNMF